MPLHQKYFLVNIFLLMISVRQVNAQSEKNSIEAFSSTQSFNISVSGATDVKVVIWGISSNNIADTIQLNNLGDGKWETTLDDISEGFYYYSYLIDKTPVYDRNTQDHYIGKSTLINAFEIIAEPDSFMIRDSEPYGNINICYYQSDFANEYRKCFVYTPYAYDHNPLKNYPVVYLLSDKGEDGSAWFIQGKLMEILDNAIYNNEIEPMLIVMESAQAFSYLQPSGPQKHMMDSIVAYELVHYIDSVFHTLDSAKYRAVAGCSFGAAEAIDVFMKHDNLFNNLGIFSLPSGFNYEEAAPDMLKTKKMDLLFIGAGSSDKSYDEINNWHNSLLAGNVVHTWDTHEGNFNWLVWRKNFYLMIRQLFRAE